MPVLSEEPSVAPADLFQRELDAEPGRWWVLHTRPRAEKTLARKLRQRGLAFFLPLHEQRRRYQRRLVRTQLPLFPGYLFLRSDDEGLTEALRTRCVANCLEVADQEQMSSDLLRVHSLIESGARLSPEERLKAGMPAEIVSGPLAGQRGKVVRCTKSLKFVIEVDFIQRGASIQVESSDIRPL